MRLFTPPLISPPWTDPIAFKSPNTGTGAKQSIAWLFKLHYGRQIDPVTTFPPTVVPTRKTLDNLFGPLDLEPLWSGGQAVRWIAAQDRKYVDGEAQGFGQMMERGVAYEGTLAAGRVIFFAALTDQLRNVVAGFTPRRGVTGGTSETGSFLQTARRFDQYRLDFGKITDGPAKVTTLRLRPGSLVRAGDRRGRAFPGPGRGRADPPAGGSPGSTTPIRAPSSSKSCPDPSPASGSSRWGSRASRRMAARARRCRRPARRFSPTTNSLHFYSDAFSADEPLPTTYLRNAEESVGQQSLEYPGAANFAIQSVSTGAGG